MIKKLAVGAAVIAAACAVMYPEWFAPEPVIRKAVEMPKVPVAEAVWKKGFSAGAAGGMPEGWILKKKPGTKPAVFTVREGDGGEKAFLHMEADNASATLITQLDGVDLNKTPIIRWRWRAVTLPEGADGSVKSRDDQAIGIYIGSGSALANKSVSYRWDTETPRGAEGNCAYGFGSVKVRWYTLRNKEDLAPGRWINEERNVAEDFKKAWGFYPKDCYLSVSCNSQYTGTGASADLAWIEVDKAPI